EFAQPRKGFACLMNGVAQLRDKFAGKVFREPAAADVDAFDGPVSAGFDRLRAAQRRLVEPPPLLDPEEVAGDMEVAAQAQARRERPQQVDHFGEDLMRSNRDAEPGNGLRAAQPDPDDFGEVPASRCPPDDLAQLLDRITEDGVDRVGPNRTWPVLGRA